MTVPPGISYYGWTGDPPSPVRLLAGDEIPDGVLVNLAPDDPLIAACVAADPVSAASALEAAQAAPAVVQAVAAAAVVQVELQAAAALAAGPGVAEPPPQASKG